jgi:hypothetical protein
MLVRQNAYRHRTPPGWNDITDAPRDGTVIELQNNWGIAPTYSICKWVHGRGWQDAADERSGVSDGSHLSWRPYEGSVEGYRDPTGGAQDSLEYWDRAVIQATGGLLNPAVERARNKKVRKSDFKFGTIDIPRPAPRKKSLLRRVAEALGI